MIKNLVKIGILFVGCFAIAEMGSAVESLDKPLLTAAAPQKAEKAKQDSHNYDDQASAELALTNRALRSKRHWYLAADLVGFTLMPTIGLRGGWIVTPDFMVEMTRGAASYNGADDKYTKTLTELKAKYFLLDNFYIDGGIAAEQWQITYRLQQSAVSPATTTSSSGNPTYITGSGTLANYGVELHIGNQWQWDHFTMGCDWVGYMYAVKKTFDIPLRTDVDQNDQKEEHDRLRRILGGDSVHLLRLYVGASF